MVFGWGFDTDACGDSFHLQNAEREREKSGARSLDATKSKVASFTRKHIFDPRRCYLFSCKDRLSTEGSEINHDPTFRIALRDADVDDDDTVLCLAPHLSRSMPQRRSQYRVAASSRNFPHSPSLIQFQSKDCISSKTNKKMARFELNFSGKHQTDVCLTEQSRSATFIFKIKQSLFLE